VRQNPNFREGWKGWLPFGELFDDRIFSVSQPLQWASCWEFTSSLDVRPTYFYVSGIAVQTKINDLHFNETCNSITGALRWNWQLQPYNGILSVHRAYIEMSGINVKWRRREKPWGPAYRQSFYWPTLSPDISDIQGIQGRTHKVYFSTNSVSIPKNLVFLSWLSNDAVSISYIASKIGWLMNAEQFMEWELARENQHQYHFVLNKSQVTWPGSEPVPPSGKLATNRLSCDTTIELTDIFITVNLLWHDA
jgi:hypothetical protein